MDTFQAVLIGVISSLLATFFFLALSWIVRTVVLPWFADKIYRGVRVDGRWVLTLSEDDKPNDVYAATFELRQLGDRVTGIYSHKDNTGKVDSYRMIGELRNTYLNASLWPVSNQMIDTAAVVLRVYTSEGAKMSGAILFIDAKGGAVQSSDIVLSRADS